MKEYYGTTIDDIFNTQSERFRPEAAEGIDAIIAYDITGEGGGKWKVIIKDNKVKTEKIEGNFGNYTLKITTDAETFAGVTLGKVEATSAFSSGKVKLDGDIKIINILPKLFTKYIIPKKEVTAKDIISTLVERFRPEQAVNLDITIGYDLAGEGGGKWTAVIKDGKCFLEEGLRENLTVNNIVSAKDYVDLMLGKLDPMVAIGAGRLRLTGNFEVAKMLPKLFAKYVPKDLEPEPELIVLKKIISIGMRYSTGPVMGHFLNALKEKKILANVCPKCGRKQLPPRESCAVCRCRVTDFIEVGPEGSLVYVDIIFYASPDPLTGETRETPYGTLYVLLDGCSGAETFWHTLKREDLFDVKRGDRVRPVWAEKRVGSIHDILYFEKVR